MHTRFLLITGLIMLPGLLSAQKGTVETRADFKRFYDEDSVEGTFVLLDYKNRRTVRYRPKWLVLPRVPSSTFKILNTLIGLETGVVTDEHFAMKWDGTEYEQKIWNRDHDLASAFTHSAYWYYREVARRVGSGSMKQWLDKVGYGNADTTGGIDRFWLGGGLRITPEQQLDFLKRLYENKLPFSRRNLDIVKRLMLVKQNDKAAVRAKDAWAFEGEKMIGWYVGYVEAGTDVFLFVNYLECAHDDQSGFGEARMAITYRILDELGIKTE